MGAGETAGWIIASIVKFILTPSIMIGAGKGMIYTWIVTSIGATIGFIFFYYLGGLVFNYIHSHRKKRAKKISRSRIKMLRYIKTSGLKGLVLLAPLLSVPVTAVLASRFYSGRKMILPLFIGVFCFWSWLLTFVSHLIKNAI